MRKLSRRNITLDIMLFKSLKINERSEEQNGEQSTFDAKWCHLLN